MSRLRTIAGAEPAQNLDNRHETVLTCADPDALCAFWAAVLGYVRDPSGEPDVVVDPVGSGPRLRFQRALQAAAKAARPRLQVEVTGSGPFVRQRALVEAEVARLVALGAVVVGRAEGTAYGVVMADPGGNEFTVG